MAEVSTPGKKKRKKKESDSKEKPQVHSYDNNFWSIILFSIGIFILLLTVVEGSAGWQALHKLIRGSFGVSVFLVSPILFYASFMIAKDKTKDMILSRFIQGGFLTLLLSSVVQVIFIGNIKGDGLSEKINILYNEGIQLKSGGVLSAVVGIPLISVFGITGAKIILILLVFVIVMLMTDFTLLRLFDTVRSPFSKIRSSFDSLREEAESRRMYRAAQRELEYEDESVETVIEDRMPEPEKIPAKMKKENVKPKKEPLPNPSDIDDEEDDDDDEYIDLGEKFNEIKNFFRNRKSKEEKKSEELVSMLNENQENISAAIVSDHDSDSIDIPIEKTPETKSDEHESPERHVVNLDKKTDYVNVPVKKAYKFPPIDFLKSGINNAGENESEIEMQNTAVKLVSTLENFGVKTSLVDIHRGPTVTRYELQPSPGVKISRITGLADDIALNLAAAGVRIEAPIPGKAAVGIEVPNASKDTVALRDLIESPEFKNSKSKLSFAVGRDIAGKAVIGDIAKMPHVIIAGSTGSGKSVCTNSIIMSILYKSTPEQVRLLLIDPKIVEFKVYDGIPHLLIPVVTDPRKAAGALNWAVQEMLRRYKLFAENNVRDLSGYNEMAAESDGQIESMPQIVIAIDELADLMMAASNEVEDAICRLAQMARAAGMHLIIATQRPTVDIITGLIKANIPSRIALSVMSQTDSRTILDTGGAEKLLGQGDMLYFPSGIPKPVRVQGCFCSTKEIEAVIDFIKKNAVAEYSDEILDEIEKNIPVPKGEKSSGNIDSSQSGDDELIEKAIDIIVDLGQASTSSLQRKLKLGYARAARIIDELEQMGIVGPSEGSKPRKILMTKAQWTERRMRSVESTNE